MQVLVTALGVRSGCLARGTRASLRPRFRAPASQGAETMQGLRPGQGRCDPTLRWHLDWIGPQRQRIYVITPTSARYLQLSRTRHEKQRGCALACTYSYRPPAGMARQGKEKNYSANHPSASGCAVGCGRLAFASIQSGGFSPADASGGRSG